MRILFISKRQYMNKDLIDDQYGRFREIPLNLSRLGHQVIGSCLSYKTKPESRVQDSFNKKSVEWHSYNAGWLKLPGLTRYVFHTYRLARQFRPDIIIGASDSIYGAIALILSRLLRIPFVFDLYDNFESFGAIRLPFVRLFYSKAIREAALLTVVSEPLKQHVIDKYSRKGPVLVIENGIDPDLIRPLPKSECRNVLHLPVEGTLIGVIGAISRSRGIETVFPAFARLSENIPDLYLVLAGKIDSDIRIDSSSNIIVLGELPYEKIPLLLSSLDVSVVSNIDTPFGRYCYPQKFVEAVASKIAPVVADIGAMHELLHSNPEILFKPGSVDDLVRSIKYQLSNNVVPNNPSSSWFELTKRLDRDLIKCS
jgi:teichuronic acid biosynthesis glycosyltransferase TuaC